MIDLKFSEISVLILTRNEEVHINRAITSARKITNKIYVLDSESTDKTCELSKKLGATVISGKFNTFSEKLNWAINNIEFPTHWVFRLDADEVLSEQLIDNIRFSISNLNSDIFGVYFRRQLWFMGRWVKYGGMYPNYSMRLWRGREVFCEVRDLDEHMMLKSGKASKLNLDIIDNPLTNLTSWVHKHNNYALLEAKSSLQSKNNKTDQINPTLFGSSIQRVRWLKINIFYGLPLFVRPFLYFFYRYFILFGFLDGISGGVFHVLHGFWYRFLIDAKIFESRKSESKNEI